MKAKLLLMNEEAVEIEPLNGETFGLKEMYDAIKCDLIEVVTLQGTDDILVIDEEGKFNSGNTINEEATEIARRHHGIAPYDYIVGNAILCDTSMVE